MSRLTALIALVSMVAALAPAAGDANAATPNGEAAYGSTVLCRPSAFGSQVYVGEPAIFAAKLPDFDPSTSTFYIGPRHNQWVAYRARLFRQALTGGNWVEVDVGRWRQTIVNERGYYVLGYWQDVYTRQRVHESWSFNVTRGGNYRVLTDIHWYATQYVPAYSGTIAAFTYWDQSLVVRVHECTFF